MLVYSVKYNPVNVAFSDCLVAMKNASVQFNMDMLKIENQTYNPLEPSQVSQYTEDAVVTVLFSVAA